MSSCKSYGPFYPWGHLNIPAESKILFRRYDRPPSGLPPGVHDVVHLVYQFPNSRCDRPFDNDRISIVVFVNSADQCPYLLMRTIQSGNHWFSLLGAHELCIGREGSALQLKRWSRSEQCSKLWAALYFLTWEGEPPSGFKDVCQNHKIIT